LPAHPSNSLEAATGFEPVNNGFADRCLASWLCRPESRSLGTLDYWENAGKAQNPGCCPLGAPPIISAFQYSSCISGAGNGTRTRDNHVGNVGLYQLSYSRSTCFILLLQNPLSILFLSPLRANHLRRPSLSAGEELKPLLYDLSGLCGRKEELVKAPEVIPTRPQG
jgi:hypothetical protein